MSSAHVYLESENAARLSVSSPVSYRKGVERYWGSKQVWMEHFYLCPAVIAGSNYNQKADLWALGVLFVEMATLLKKPKYKIESILKGERSQRQYGQPITESQMQTGRDKIVSNYPKFIVNIIAALLKVDTSVRASCSDILSFAGINLRVNKVIRNTNFTESFSQGLKDKIDRCKLSEAEK